MICGSGHLLCCFGVRFSTLVGIADIPNAKGKPI